MIVFAPVEDQVRRVEPEREKRRRSLESDPSQGPTAKRREMDPEPAKRKRSPKPGPSRESMEQQPKEKKKGGRPQKVPVLQLIDSSDEETVHMMDKDISITILPGTDPPCQGSTESAGIAKKTNP